jgi:threonine/homoserine/homoserine lactone efflux protein
MSRELTVAFIIFIMAASCTPGPNNIMVMTSGVNYGFRRTLPHIAGVALGFGFLVLVAGLGLGAVVAANPLLQTILKYAGVAYLIYLAFRIALSKPAGPAKAAIGRPMGFLAAALFQWVNVKGLVTTAGMITAYAAIAAYPWNIAVLASLSLVFALISTVIWTLFGSAMQPLLSSQRRLRIFNVVMAVLLVASLYPVLAG